MEKNEPDIKAFRRPVSERIKNANGLPITEYKEVIQEKRKATKKRDIKSRPAIFKGKRFFVCAILAFSTIAAALTYSKEIPEYKEAAATRIVQAVKNELGADSIRDNSTALSSNSAREEYVVLKDGETYAYKAYISDGERVVIRNELNEETIKAISIAAAAQNGNVFEAIRANDYADKIEAGKIDLVIDERVKENPNNGFEIGDD